MSGFRDFVTGTSGLICVKFAREVMYAMLLDIMVSNCTKGFVSIPVGALQPQMRTNLLDLIL